MKRFILASLVLVPLVSGKVCRADQTLEVISLDLGGCWIHYEPLVSSWKIASFSDGAAFYMGGTELQQFLNPSISTELRGVFPSFPASGTETYFQCSGGGHFFWTSIPDGTVPLCAWSKVQRNPDTGQLALSFQGLYPDHDYQAGRPCNGESRKTLLVFLNSGRDIQAVVNYLSTSKRYAGVVTGLSTIGTSIILARLDDSYDFQENVVKKLIESDKALADDLSMVDYDRRVSIVGEAYRVFAGNYPGY